jgi:nicotinate-nucleotide adenylyltransferase
VALFGGTFDPVHRGHLAIARAAADTFGLSHVYFAPADIPPHKQKRKLTDFQHRFAMLALATAEDKRFVPSLLDSYTGQPNYSIDSVRRLKKTLKKADKLYFLIGMDAFKDISTWRMPEELLAECDFIVANRPGHSLADVARSLPKHLQPSEAYLRNIRKAQANGSLVVPGATLHLLKDVHERVSSTQIRAAAAKSVTQLARYVPRLVAEYIRKEGLYQPGSQKAEATPGAKMLSFHQAPLRRSKAVTTPTRSE